MWTESFGVRLHFLTPRPRFSIPTSEKLFRSATWVRILQHIRRPPVVQPELPDAGALAEAFHLNHDTVHQPTIRFGTCFTEYTS
jgi:hypothetical protein